MALNKMILIGGGAVVLLACGIGGTFAVLSMTHHSTPAKVVAAPVVVPPKPIYFATLDSVVVSVPADVGDPATTFVQFTVQLSTFDQNAVASFTTLQPIIKSDVIALLMTETGKTLSDPAARADLAKHCLDISNNVLNTNANYTPQNPFTAAYITNLVEQD